MDGGTNVLFSFYQVQDGLGAGWQGLPQPLPHFLKTLSQLPFQVRFLLWNCEMLGLFPSSDVWNQRGAQEWPNLGA